MKTDGSIQGQVQEELAWEPSIEAAEMGVAVQDGIVTITGTVRTFGQKHRAEKAAMGVRGVRAVANDLVVELPTTHEKTDAEIAGDILRMFELNDTVPHDRVTIVVSQGLATFGR